MKSTLTDGPRRAVDSAADAIEQALARIIGPQKFRIWFKNATRFTFAGGYLKVGVPNLFVARWLENHFLDAIAQAVKEVTGSPAKITFAVEADLCAQQRRTQLDSQARLVRSAGTKAAPIPKRQGPQHAKSAQRKLPMTLDTFVVGPCNELAYNAAKVVVNEQQSPFNPLFIHGGYGLGKTHLLQGICNAVPQKRPGIKWLYLSAEEFANQFVLALKLKKLEQFRSKIRQTDLLVIDDIHFLASKPATQEEFLHTFNTINLAGKQLVLASDAHPKMIGQLSEKLVSRFVSGMVVKIEPPDFQTRCRICRQYAQRILSSSLAGPMRSTGSQNQLPESVVKYIAEHLRSNVRELEGALLKLVAFASLQNQKITLAMAKSVLAEHLARTDPIVHVSDIESAVATYFGITPADIHSSRKDRTVALARHFGMYLIRKHTRMSSSEIGRFMGNKNHATVLLACKKIEQLLKNNTELHWNGPAGNKVQKARTVLAQLEASL